MTGAKMSQIVLPPNAASRPRALSLATEGITKVFGAMRALDDVSVQVDAGSFHALLGENGAGKSTLVKCIMGFYGADAGAVLLDGARISLHSPRQAQAQGIGMVYQHFTLVPCLTAAENLVMSRADAPGVINWRSEKRALEAFMDRMPFRVRLDSQVADLSAGEKQKLEILKLLYLDQRFLILDEPTSVMTPGEADEVLTLLRGMAERKEVTVLMISHKFREVKAFCDSFTVLRRGRVTGRGDAAAASVAEMSRMMIGETELRERAPRRDRAAPQPRLTLDRVCAADETGRHVVEDVSLSIGAGEIVGIAGVAGNGQKELFETLMGVRHATAGAVVFDGKEITNLAPREVQKAGMGHIPDDRFAEGLVPDFDIQSNLVLGAQRDPAFSRLGFLRFGAIRQFARDAMEAFAIQAPSAQTACRTLSGGNAQKVIVAREFAQSTKAILANQPSRGLDIGVIEYMHNRLIEKRNQNYAILIASEELDELRALSDRIVVIFKGRIVGEFAHDAVDLEKIGLLMAGHVNEAAQEILTRNA